MFPEADIYHTYDVFARIRRYTEIAVVCDNTRNLKRQHPG